MSNMTLIDSHVHLWDSARLDYPWLTGIPAIDSPHLPGEYRDASEGYDVEKLVFVQCDVADGQSRDEVRWITELAETDEPRIAGIVAWAPVAEGSAVAPELEWLATMPLVRGVRQLIQPEVENAFCAKPDFVRGVQLVGQAGLSFDLCIKGDGQFASVLALVEQCPDVRFVLDHIGKPFIAEGIVEPWAGYIGQLAEASNVFCKISGVTTEAVWESWSPDSLRLGGNSIDDDVLDMVANLQNLTRLSLENTAVDDKMIRPVSEVESLVTLNVTNTRVTADSFASLSQLPFLESVYAWNTETTPAALDAVRTALAPVKIIGGATLSLPPPEPGVNEVMEEPIDAAIDE